MDVAARTAIRILAEAQDYSGNDNDNANCQTPSDGDSPIRGADSGSITFTQPIAPGTYVARGA
jgi:hypothetical protein